MVFEKSLCLVFPHSISVSFFKISARAQPEARSYKYRTCFPQSISVSFFRISARASPKQGLINFPSISAAKLPLFPHIAYRQILTFYLKPR